jgi:hypothetical protein
MPVEQVDEQAHGSVPSHDFTEALVGPRRNGCCGWTYSEASFDAAKLNHPAEGRQILLTVDRATNRDDLSSMSTALCDGSG